MKTWGYEILGCVDLEDMIRALQVVLNVSLGETVEVEDLNEDGRIGMADAILLLQRIAGPRCD